MGKKGKDGICIELFGIETTLSFRWEKNGEKEGERGMRRFIISSQLVHMDLFFAFLLWVGAFGVLGG